MVKDYKVVDIEWDKGRLSDRSPYDLEMLINLPQEAMVHVASDLSWLEPSGKVGIKEIRKGIKNLLEEEFGVPVLSFRIKLEKEKTDEFQEAHHGDSERQNA